MRAALLSTILGATALLSQTTPEAELRREVDALRQEVKTLRADVDQLKAARAEANPIIEVAGHPTMGNADAKVVLIEYSDFQCPFCLEYFKTTYPKVVSDYVKTGKIRYTTRDFPSESNHPDSVKAALAADCAGDQGKYWEMHDQLFTNQKTLGSGGIEESAKAAGLKMDQFETCRTSAKYGAAVQKDIVDAGKVAVRGTPTFYFALIDPADPNRMKLMRGLTGAQPLANFQQTIEGLLALAAAKPDNK